MNMLLVMIGGAMGAGGRFLVSGWLHAQVGGGFPWGTFAVNIMGSFAIGIVASLAERGGLSSATSLFLTVGVLGGFTTYSAFSNETLRLLANGDVAMSLLNAFGQLATGVVAVYAGFSLIRLVAF